MKKRILSVLSCAALLAAVMSGCTSTDPKQLTAYEIYTKVNEKMEDVSSMEMDMKMDGTMEVAGQTMPMNVDGIVKYVMRSATDMDMEMDMTTEAMGSSLPMKSYYKSGFMYTEVMGQKMKTELPIDQMLEASNLQIIKFSEDAIKVSNVEDLEDSKKLSFTVDGNAVNELLRGQISSMLQSVPGSENLDISFGDLEYIITADKDYMMQSTTAVFDAEFTIEGQNVKMSYSVDMNLLGTDNVTINFPADLDSYPAA